MVSVLTERPRPSHQRRRGRVGSSLAATCRDALTTFHGHSQPLTSNVADSAISREGREEPWNHCRVAYWILCTSENDKTGLNKLRGAGGAILCLEQLPLSWGAISPVANPSNAWPSWYADIRVAAVRLVS